MWRADVNCESDCERVSDRASDSERESDCENLSERREGRGVRRRKERTQKKVG